MSDETKNVVSFADAKQQLADSAPTAEGTPQADDGFNFRVYHIELTDGQVFQEYGSLLLTNIFTAIVKPEDNGNGLRTIFAAPVDNVKYVAEAGDGEDTED